MLYSIGHGNKSKESFLDELKAYNIQYLIDVRSKPFSRFNSHFNQNELNYFLKENDITYVFLGNLLGGLPNDPSCYNFEGKVDYDILRSKSFFQEGISRLEDAHKKGFNVALMCSESKPQECHRSKVIGQELLSRKVRVSHIINNNKVKDQTTVLLEATKGLGDKTLFSEGTSLTSRRSYI